MEKQSHFKQVSFLFPSDLMVIWSGSGENGDYCVLGGIVSAPFFSLPRHHKHFLTRSSDPSSCTFLWTSFSSENSAGHSEHLL